MPNTFFTRLLASASLLLWSGISDAEMIRVTILGFDVITQTDDDATESDGGGDEVKIQIVVERKDDGRIVYTNTAETRIFGDTRGKEKENQIQAGSDGDMGGLK